MYGLNYNAHLAEAQTNVKATKKNGSVCKNEKMYELWVYICSFIRPLFLRISLFVGAKGDVD